MSSPSSQIMGMRGTISRMSLWLLIISALTVQEGLSTDAVLLEAVHAHYSVWIIHAIWLFVTVVQTLAGYFLGKWIRRRFADTKMERWFEKSARKLEASIGKQGEAVALVLGSAIVSPAATAFLAAWLDISLTKILAFVVLGDFIWYALTWVTVVGATTIISDLKYGVVIVFVIAVVWLIASRFRKSS
jgi:membrane protein YqaA with SNARE-associated domain